MIIDRSFYPCDRYRFDFGECGYSKGWAQMDTGQDAAYYGQWINPTALKYLSYCEGDITRITFEDDAEMVVYVADIMAWNVDNGHRWIGIDPGLELLEPLVHAGLSAYLHEADKTSRL